jgi:Fe-S cluster assembly ATPase SufC
MQNGKIIKTGSAELAKELEIKVMNGYKFKIEFFNKNKPKII